MLILTPSIYTLPHPINLFHCQKKKLQVVFSNGIHPLHHFFLHWIYNSKHIPFNTLLTSETKSHGTGQVIRVNSMFGQKRLDGSSSCQAFLFACIHNGCLKPHCYIVDIQLFNVNWITLKHPFNVNDPLDVKKHDHSFDFDLFV